MGPQGPAGADADMGAVAQMIQDGDAATLEQAKAYTENGTNPGATGTLLLTAGRTNSSPTSFGGVNLIRGLNSSMQ